MERREQVFFGASQTFERHGMRADHPCNPVLQGVPPSRLIRKILVTPILTAHIRAVFDRNALRPLAAQAIEQPKRCPSQ